MTMRIAAEQLCVDYNGTVALYDASLKLPSGCICGLVGMNGAGKSTLLKALTGFIRPSRGRIRINGCSIAEAQRQQSVAYVPQSEEVDCQFPVSVWDVVMMGRYGSMNALRIPRSSDRVAVRDALERVDLLDLSRRQNSTDRAGAAIFLPPGRPPASEPPWSRRTPCGHVSKPYHLTRQQDKMAEFVIRPVCYRYA